MSSHAVFVLEFWCMEPDFLALSNREPREADPKLIGVIERARSLIESLTNPLLSTAVLTRSFSALTALYSPQDRAPQLKDARAGLRAARSQVPVATDLLTQAVIDEIYPLLPQLTGASQQALLIRISPDATLAEATLAQLLHFVATKGATSLISANDYVQWVASNFPSCRKLAVAYALDRLQ